MTSEKHGLQVSNDALEQCFELFLFRRRRFECRRQTRGEEQI